MAAISWAFGVAGNWSDKTKWSGDAIPTSGDDVTIAALGAYRVTLAGAQSAKSVTLDSAKAQLFEGDTASLTVSGAIDLEAGSLILQGANSFGSVDESGGVLQLFNASALGTATVSLDGGEVSAMKTETIANKLVLSGSAVALDAAAGTTADFGGGGWALANTNQPLTVQFGSSSRTGTVVWHTPAESSTAGNVFVDVAGGTLEAGDASLSNLLNNRGVTVAKNATIDLAGYSATLNDLAGAGAVVDSGAAAALTIGGGSVTWKGVISGALAVTYDNNAHVFAAQTYTGGSTITGQLVLEGAGSITGPIIDTGNFANADNAGVETVGALSGTGELRQEGKGTTVLSHTDAGFSGSTTLDNGKLIVGVAGALGTSAATLLGGELVSEATQTLAGPVTDYENATLAAATGTILTLTSTTLQGPGPINLTFGDAANAGTVVVKSNDDVTGDPSTIAVKVAGGTLKAGGGGDLALADILFYATSTAIAAGATLDINGSATPIYDLASAGTITNSSVTTANLETQGVSKISGAITGKVGLDVQTGATTLSGADTYSGGTKIESGAALDLGAGGASGSITGNIDDEGALSVNETGAVSLSGAISGAGTLTQTGGGTLTLSGKNTFAGGVTATKGELIVTTAQALGTGGVTLHADELVAGASVALGNAFDLQGTTTLAAAAGATLGFTGAASLYADTGGGPLTLAIGDAADTGTVVFDAGLVSVTDSFPIHLKLNDGTVKAAGSDLDTIASAAADVAIVAGATLDLDGSDVNTPNLASAGLITNSAIGMATLDLHGKSTVSGVIAGKTQVVVDDGATTLSGADTYTGGTAIAGGATLNVGAGGATGSISGKIDDEGLLVSNETAAVALAGAISGAGQFGQAGTGATTLSGANSFSGGTHISRGELIAASASALGSGGPLLMTGGELLASVNFADSQDLTASGTIAFAAAHGKTLTLSLGDLTVGAGTLYFGDAGDDGTIILSSSGVRTYNDPTHTHVEVRAGVLKMGDFSGAALTDSAQTTRIDAGATIDAAGNSPGFRNLTGAGTLTNSGVSEDLALVGSTNFSGAISGAENFLVAGAAILSGALTFTGDFQIEDVSLTLSGTASENAYFAGGGTLILTAPSKYTGQVQNFTSGSTVDLRNITAGAAAHVGFDATTGVLTVSDGTHTDKVNFGAGSGLVLGNFGPTGDGDGGTDIVWQTPPPGPASTHVLAGAMASFGVGTPASGTVSTAHRSEPRVLAIPHAG